MTSMSKARMHPLLDLANERSVNRISQLEKVIGTIDAAEIVELHADLVEKAPRRHSREKALSRGLHRLDTPSHSRRVEEHLAMAIYNAHRERPLTLSTGESIRIIDYQTQLKARRSDRGVGKQFGVSYPRGRRRDHPELAWSRTYPTSEEARV